MTFIDFTNAYDSVNRSKLYKILKEKNILLKHEIDIIKFIHSNLKVTIGKFGCSTTTGVPQGLKMLL